MNKQVNIKYINKSRDKVSTYSPETSLLSGSEDWGPVYGFGQGLEWVQACLLGSAETLSPSAFFRGGSFSLEEEGEVSDTGSFVSFCSSCKNKNKKKQMK